MDILEKIEREIYVCWQKNIEPTIILIHPLLATRLIEEVFFTVNRNKLSAKDLSQLRYRGIRILRSEDLTENEIIVK